MNNREKHFYCHAITLNRYKYNSHGREVNKTFDKLLVPSMDHIPDWVNNTNIPPPHTKEPYHNKKVSLNDREWGWFLYKDIFDIQMGKSSKIKSKENNFIIGSSKNFNGTNGEYQKEKPYYKKECITVGNGGNTGCGQAFYQSIPFNAKSTVNILYIKNKKINTLIGMFVITVIKLEQYRFNYGRKWSLQRMQTHKIKLPITNTGSPDWQFMEDYIKALPCSSNL